MFKQGDKVVYPFDGYGVGEVKSVFRGGLSNELYYYIYFDSGNNCNLQETHRLVAFNSENKEHVEMANQYTKEAQLAGKKTKGKAEKAVKEEKAAKAEKPVAVKKAADATKTTAPEGYKSLSEIREGDPKLGEKALKAGRKGVEGSLKIGSRWFYSPELIESLKS